MLHAVGRSVRARTALSILVGILCLGTVRADATADEDPAADLLRGFDEQIEAAEKGAADKAVFAELRQAREAVARAGKEPSRSDGAFRSVQTARKIVRHVIDAPRGSPPDVVGHLEKAVAFADAYLALPPEPQKPIGPTPTPTPTPNPGPKPKPPKPTPVPGPKPQPQPPKEVPPVGPVTPEQSVLSHGRFRVWLNGFTVTTPTYDGALDNVDPNGVGDEVALISHVYTVDAAGTVRSSTSGPTRTATMGALPPNGAHAGTRTPAGGLRRGDAFPTATPWIRAGDSRTVLPPTVLFEGELAADGPAAVIVPTIWEWDGVETFDLERSYAAAMDRDRATIGRTAAARIASPASGRGFVVPGSELGIGNTMLFDMGAPANRPIGATAVGRRFGFSPKALVLTYRAANEILSTDLGLGRGVVPVRYQDDPRWMQGDYTLFLEVERVVGARGPAVASGTSGRTRFDPARDGFRFANTFKNDLGVGGESGGLCGGMMYTALDYFEAGLPPPRIDYRPAIGTPLQTFLYDRQTQQLLHNRHLLAHMIALLTVPAREAGLAAAMTVQNIGDLRTKIDAGTPAVLLMQNPHNPLGHSVLAIGYEMGRYRGDFGAFREDLRIFVYDPNFPLATKTLMPDFALGRFVYLEEAALRAEEVARGDSETQRLSTQWLTFGVDNAYRRHALPRIEEPDIGGTDGLTRELRLTIRTGGDELVAGNDDVEAVVNIAGRPPRVYPNLNHRMRWVQFYDQTLSLPLDAPTPDADIVSVVISKTSNPAPLTGALDVWDVDVVKVWAYGGGVPGREIFSASGAPLARITGRFTPFTATIPH